MKVKVLKKLKGSKLGLYDSGKPEVSVVADKVIDITHYCPESKRCVVKYANVVRGRIAQICNWYEKDKDLGSQVHYFINEETPESLSKDEVFNRVIEMRGGNSLKVAKIIFANK